VYRSAVQNVNVAGQLNQGEGGQRQQSDIPFYTNTISEEKVNYNNPEEILAAKKKEHFNTLRKSNQFGTRDFTLEFITEDEFRGACASYAAQSTCRVHGTSKTYITEIRNRMQITITAIHVRPRRF
jgi:uncharacterized protein (DUF2235 family)